MEVKNIHGSLEPYSRFRSSWPPTHPSPLREVITLSPNRKPHQKKIMFLWRRGQPSQTAACSWASLTMRCCTHTLHTQSILTSANILVVINTSVMDTGGLSLETWNSHSQHQPSWPLTKAWRARRCGRHLRIRSGERWAALPCVWGRARWFSVRFSCVRHSVDGSDLDWLRN